MILWKASDLKKVFVKWSHGTLYNRLESLDIKDNSLFIVKNETTGNSLYNYKAVCVLKEQYLKEFTSNTEEERNIIDKTIVKYMSSKSSVENSSDTEKVESEKKCDVDKNDNVDTLDNNSKINDVILTYINKNYIPVTTHKEITSNLQKQIDILKIQLEKETANNEKLVDTIKLREQKDAVIEQQKLIQLQDNIKLIQEPTEQQEQKGGLVAWFKDLKKYI